MIHVQHRNFIVIQTKSKLLEVGVNLLKVNVNICVVMKLMYDYVTITLLASPFATLAIYLL